MQGLALFLLQAMESFLKGILLGREEPDHGVSLWISKEKGTALPCSAGKQGMGGRQNVVEGQLGAKMAPRLMWVEDLSLPALACAIH